MADKPTSSKSRKQRAQAEQVEQTPAPRPQPAEAAQTVEQFVTEKATQAAQKRRVEAALSVLDGAGDDKVRAKACVRCSMAPTLKTAKPFARR